MSDSDPIFVGQFDIDFQFHGAFARHTYRRGRLTNRLSPGYSFFYQRAGLSGGNAVEGGIHRLVLRDDLTLGLGQRHTLRAGVRLEGSFGFLRSDYFRPPKEGDLDWNATTQERVVVDAAPENFVAAAYVSDEIRLGWLTLTPGLRVTYDVGLGAAAVSPRLGARWRVAKPLLLKAAVGLYHRLPDMDERVPGFGNDGLTFERAVHVVAGARLDITDAVHAEVQGYYKSLHDLVYRTRSLSAAGAGRIYENGARGQAFGGELLLRARFSRRLFGWISYSVARSERSDGPGTGLRLHDLDQTHNLVMVGTWEFLNGWRVGLRFQVTSGQPYTEVTGSLFHGDTGSYTPVYDVARKNALRGEAYHRLDLRLDKSWTFDAWILRAYLDVQNVYYHANPVGTAFNYDYSERAVARGIPLFPSVGVRGEF